jgi:hypothetical protein
MKVILRRSLRRGGFVILLAAASWVVAMPAVAQDQSPTASGVPSGPSVSTSPIALPESGVLDRRSYYVDAGPDIAPARFSFSVPSGWVSYEGGVTNGVGLYPSRGWEAEAGFETWIVSHVFSDACHHTTLVDVGTTVDELAAALAAQQGVVASGPTDVTVAGHPAKRVELTVPRDLDVATCENSRIRFWPGPGPDMTSGMCCMSPMSRASAGWSSPGMVPRPPRTI